MRELIKEIEKKVKTTEDLIFFIRQIDLAKELISKEIKKSVSEILERKIDPVLLSALLKIEKESEELGRKKIEKEKEKYLKKEAEIKEKLKEILAKEKELEEKIKKIEIEEEKLKGKTKEKEVEKERWALEEERIKIEKEKWELKEKLKENKENLEKIKSLKGERNIRELLFFLEFLRDNLTSFNKVNLQIAFDPSEKIISKISQWFEENLKEKVILNFEINPRIIGGVIVEYKGKIFDFSLKSQLKKELKK